MSRFRDVQESPPDPIFGIAKAFADDPREHKVNLGVGVYRTADGKIPLLNVVRQAEEQLVGSTSKNYLPIDGDREFVDATMELAFGVKEPHIYGGQTVGSTGALRIAGEILREQLGLGAIYLPSPTWANHRGIFHAARLQIESYRHYNWSEGRLDMEGMLQDLQVMPEGSALLFHACCHNPTGVDPTIDEWGQILEVVQHRSLLPIFDCAYQGFAEGVDEDMAGVRLFLQAGIPMAVCYSYSKNMALYAERIGALFWVGDDEREARVMGSQVRAHARTSYSNPPMHGSQVVKTVWREMRESWLEELADMRGRMRDMRATFLAEMRAVLPSHDFAFLERQRGLFSFVGLEQSQAERLTSEYAIYLPKSGRINVTGLNSENLRYVVDAFVSVMS
jgi:aromatic-amino-acid transaminase